FRSYHVSMSVFNNWSHDAVAGGPSASAWGRAHVSGSVNVNSNLEFKNFWRVDLNVQAKPETMDRSGTRGGPLMVDPRSMEARIHLRTDRRNALSLEPNVSVRRGALGSGNDFRTSLQVNYRPSARIEIEVEPRYSHGTLGAQYVGTSSVLPDPDTFNKRFLFGEVVRNELSFPTRINATFSPALSFQLYAQPLLSSGDYSNFKQLAAPASYAFTRFGEGSATNTGSTVRCEGGRTCVDASNVRHFDFDGNGTSDYAVSELDFNVRSLIGNAVFRWEYRPGSTLFLVWQRQQRSYEVLGDFSARRDWSALMRAPTDNTFLVKMSYWLPL
ncbi:MAG: DUF5916 domain-containing protein, partial [Gemmatimonadaceae bacterium]